MSWVKHFTNKSSDFEGYVVSKQQLNLLIEEYELDTHSRYAVSRSRYTYNINVEDIKFEAMKVVWQDPKAFSKKVSPNIPDDGVPLIHLGSCTMCCHRGSKRPKPKDLEVNETDTGIGNLMLQKKGKVSKKLDCPSIIKIRRVIKFPEYSLLSAKNVKHSRHILKELHDLLCDDETRFDVEMEMRWYVRLPTNSSHLNHTVGEEESDSRMDIDKRVSAFIHKKVLNENVCNTKDMLTLVHSFVKDVLFKNKPPPPRSNTRYWPKLTHIRNHMMLTNLKRRETALNQDDLERLVENWWVEFPEDSIMFRSKSICKKEAQNIDEASGEKFMFVQQTCWQRKLLYMYGDEICILDLYKPSKYSLPHYFIIVPTNCMYSIVASFILEVEDKLDLEEALGVIRTWNPGWMPRCFMTTFSDSQMGAIATVFPDSNTEILVCDFLRLQFWSRWLSAKGNNLGHHKDEILNLMRNTAESFSEAEFIRNLNVLREHEGWRSNCPLQRWFDRWVNNVTKWVKFYRSEKYIIVDTHDEMEKLNGIIKQMFLNNFCHKTTQTVTELAEILLTKLLPFLHNKYCQTNLKWRAKAVENNLDVPPFLHDRPPPFVEHLAKRWESTQDISSLIQQDSYGTYHVISLSSEETFEIVLDNGYGMPSCNCSDWKLYHYPCKHILAGFTSGYFVWSDLPLHYNSNPLLMLDTTFVGTPKNQGSLEKEENSIDSTDLIAEVGEFRSRLKKLDSLSHLSYNKGVFQRVNSILKECEEQISNTCPVDSHFLTTYEFSEKSIRKRMRERDERKKNAKRKFDDESSILDIGAIGESVLEVAKIEEIEEIGDIDSILARIEPDKSLNDSSFPIEEPNQIEPQDIIVPPIEIRPPPKPLPSIVIKTRVIKGQELYSTLLSL